MGSVYVYTSLNCVPTNRKEERRRRVLRLYRRQLVGPERPFALSVWFSCRRFCASRLRVSLCVLHALLAHPVFFWCFIGCIRLFVLNALLFFIRCFFLFVSASLPCRASRTTCEQTPILTRRGEASVCYEQRASGDKALEGDAWHGATFRGYAVY